MNLTPEQKIAVVHGEPVFVLLDDTECVVVRKDLYDRLKPLIADDPISISEQRYLLREIGLLAGWSDPDMDVYDEHLQQPHSLRR